MTFTDLGLARRAHGRAGEAIVALKTGTKQGRMAQELALVIHGAHQPCWAGSYVACENHMTAQEEEWSWPCDEARKLAMGWGSILSDGRP